MQTDDTVIARRDGRVGRILLNRPKALNALDLPMIRACTRALTAWRDDPHVHAVVIEGAGDRAFCAGGDIRALRQYQLDGEHHRAEAFFSEEYALNLMIATYPKPYVALIDGICMGGGIGVSVHAPYRVATEHAAFAMPETAIGFFPDIGATFFLPRLPGQLGIYLGLTGARHAGRRRGACRLRHAFHVPRAELPALSRALAAGRAGRARAATPRRCRRSRWRRSAPRSTTASAPTALPEIVRRLEADGGDWADADAATLRDRVALGAVLDAGGAAPRRGPDAAAMPGGRTGADPHHDAPSRLRRGRARHGGGQGPHSRAGSRRGSRQWTRLPSPRCSARAFRLSGDPRPREGHREAAEMHLAPRFHSA